MEHIQNPFDFLKSLYVPGANTMAFIEVPNFQWILDKRCFWDIYYEHVNYFTLQDFKRAFSRVLKSGEFFQGQYIYAAVDLSSMAELPWSFKEISMPLDFGPDRSPWMREICQRPYKKVIWGASSKGTMVARALLERGSEVSHLVDINPKKQGLYISGTGLLVEDPKVLLGLDFFDLLVMNGNYAPEIQACLDQAGAKYRLWRIDERP